MESATGPIDLDKLLNAMTSANQKMLQDIMTGARPDPMAGYAEAYKA